MQGALRRTLCVAKAEQLGPCRASVHTLSRSETRSYATGIPRGAASHAARGAGRRGIPHGAVSQRSHAAPRAARYPTRRSIRRGAVSRAARSLPPSRRGGPSWLAGSTAQRAQGTRRAQRRSSTSLKRSCRSTRASPAWARALQKERAVCARQCDSHGVRGAGRAACCEF